MPGSQTMATTAVTVALWRLLGTGNALGFHDASFSALTITQSPSPFHRRQGTGAVVVAQATLGFSCTPTFLRYFLKHSPCSSHTPPPSPSLIPAAFWSERLFTCKGLALPAEAVASVFHLP